MPLKMKYFVLKPEAKSKNDLFSKASQEAMQRYADIIDQIDEELGQSLRKWSRKEALRQSRLAL